MTLDDFIKAATVMDWYQLVLNGGPPCFHIENKRFCGRAKRWAGHESMHIFVSLDNLVRAAHSEGEKVGWEKGMRQAMAIVSLDDIQGYDCHEAHIQRAIDARKDK